jgi:hypothetical protein
LAETRQAQCEGNAKNFKEPRCEFHDAIHDVCAMTQGLIWHQMYDKTFNFASLIFTK